MLYMDERKVTFDESIEKEWRSWSYDRTINDPKNNKHDVVTVNGKRKLQFSFKAGSLISSIAERGLISTQEYSRFPKMEGGFFLDESGNLDQQSSHDGIVAVMKTFPEVTNGPYDELRGDRQAKVEFRMAPHAKPSAIPSYELYRKVMESDSIQLKRFREIRRLGLVKKRYDYMHGKSANTEVVDFSMEYDNLWRAVRPVASGVLGDHEENMQNASGETRNHSESRIAALQAAKKHVAGMSIDKSGNSNAGGGSERG